MLCKNIIGGAGKATGLFRETRKKAPPFVAGLSLYDRGY